MEPNEEKLLEMVGRGLQTIHALLDTFEPANVEGVDVMVSVARKETFDTSRVMLAALEERYEVARMMT